MLLEVPPNKQVHGSFFTVILFTSMIVCRRKSFQQNKTEHQISSDSPVFSRHIHIFVFVLPFFQDPVIQISLTHLKTRAVESGPIVVVLFHPTSQDHFHFLPVCAN